MGMSSNQQNLFICYHLADPVDSAPVYSNEVNSLILQNACKYMLVYEVAL